MFSTIKKQIVFGLCVFLVGMFVMFLIGRQLNPTDKTTRTVKTTNESGETKTQEITFEYINKKLENISELASAEMVYNTIYTLKEGKIPLLTKKGFSMVYTATVKAGIDMSLIKVDVTEDEVKVDIPKSEIQTIYVDPDSIQFYDQKSSLFNNNKMTDVTEAVSAAEDDIEKKVDKDGLLKKASEETEYIIKGILEGSVGDKKLVVRTLD